MVSRSPGGAPDELNESLDEAPSDLVFLSWFDLEAWDRAQVGDVIPPMALEAEGPAFFIHGTTEGAVVRFGGTLDVAQFEAMLARQAEVAEVARGFFDQGQALLYGTEVPKDPVAARGWYEKASALGHTEATYAIGYLYGSGLGVEQSYDQALSWYGKAAAAGSINGLLEAGHIFYYGRGREVDYDAAFAMYHAAATMASSYGQFNVGLMFESGLGVVKNLDTAREWYLLAAERQHVGAQKRLGWMYRRGVGVAAKDFDEAVRWYRAAAGQEDAEAMRELGSLFSRFGYDQKSVDLPRSAEWYRKASEAGDLEATYELATIYYFGIGVERDDARAFELYYRLRDDAPERHRGTVLFHLARAYQFGKHVAKDLTEAARLMLASAAEDYSFGKAAMASFYFYGIGVEVNEKEAVKWLLRSAEERPDAALLFGLAYELGKGVEQNFDEAIAWYRRSADKGYAPAQWTLGDHHERGVGVDQNWSEAAAWYRRAADQGFAGGQYSLGRLYLMGQGLEQDLVLSYVWLSLAERGASSENGRKEAKSLLDAVAGRLSAVEIERARERIEAFKPTRESGR